MIDRIQTLAKQNHNRHLNIRHHLHANPELSFKEFETSKYVQAELDDIGIPFKAGYVETGIVAHIEGKDPGSKVIALRADLDALPITEENDVPYKSTNHGVMHACGHDVHTTCLLGAARILNELKSEFAGTIKLIFQPGEERLPGGASLMIKEGALLNPNPSGIIGQHVYPQLEAGKVGFRPGMYMASTDEIYVTVKGKGGHAALPHFNIDPVVISAQIIVALQQIASRYSQPDIPVVLSFGKINANGATNVIPDEVKIEGTFRTMNEDLRFKLHERMKEISVSMARGMGGDCDFDIHVGYPFLVNDEALTLNSQEAARQYLGAENVVDLGLRMTAEDFAYYTQEIPGCFYRLGVNNKAKGMSSGLHTSTFDIDESALETGVGLMAHLALDALNKS